MSNINSLFSEEVILPFMARNSLRLASFFLPRERWTTTVVVFASVMLFIWAKENGTKAGFLSFLFAASVITLNSALRALALRLNFRSDTFQIKYARYQGDWKDYNRWYILIPTIASALILCYTFFELNEVLSRPHYAATLFSFCFVVPQWLFFADILDKEREIKNFADVLAWNYYLEYLELVLPRLEEQIYRSYQFFREINCKKLFILLPKNCYTHGLISDADPKVKLVGRLPAVNINWAGISQRSYQHTVYRIETLAPGGKVRESAPFVMEYATPLVSMYNMSYYNDSLITPLERDHLVGSVQFLWKPDFPLCKPSVRSLLDHKQWLFTKDLLFRCLYKNQSNQIIKTIERLQLHQWLTAIRATFFIFPQTRITSHRTVLWNLCNWMMTFCFF